MMRPNNRIRWTRERDKGGSIECSVRMHQLIIRGVLSRISQHQAVQGRVPRTKEQDRR